MSHSVHMYVRLYHDGNVMDFTCISVNNFTSCDCGSTVFKKVKVLYNTNNKLFGNRHFCIQNIVILTALGENSTMLVFIFIRT